MVAAVAELQDRQHCAWHGQHKACGSDYESGEGHLSLCSRTGSENSAHAYDYPTARRRSATRGPPRISSLIGCVLEGRCATQIRSDCDPPA